MSPQSSLRHFYYIAPPFQDMGGHYYNYACGLQDACRKKQLAFTAIGKKSDISAKLSLDQNLHFKPHFHQIGPQTIGGKRIRGLGWLYTRIVSRRDLNQLNSIANNPSHLLFIEEIRTLYPPALDEWLATLKPSSATLVFILRYGIFSVQHNQWLPAREQYTKLLKILEHHAERLNIHCVSDSSLVADQFLNCSPIPTHVIPTHTESTQTTRHPVTPNSNEITTFYMPGASGTLKGTDFLIEAIIELNKRQSLENAHFILQFFPNPHPEIKITEAFRYLNTLNLKNVTVIEGSIAKEEYYKLIEQCDFILTPYQPDRYQATSGPFSEALALGKPVLTSENTWMSYILKTHGVGITFTYGDRESLIEAIKQCLSSPNLKQSALDQANCWRNQNNPECILSRLVNFSSKLL